MLVNLVFQNAIMITVIYKESVGERFEVVLTSTTPKGDYNYHQQQKKYQ